MFTQYLAHLLLEIAGLVAGNLSKVVVLRGVDNATAGVDKQAAVFVHAVLTDFFQRAALSTHTGNKEEMARSNTSYILEQATLRSTHNIHHILLIAPLLTDAQHFLKQMLRLGRQRSSHLEIARTNV